MVLKRKTKIPKLASGEWFGPTTLLNQELDLMPTQENKAVLSEDGKYYSITGQKCGSLMQVSVLCFRICSYWR
jgi:hypothetical protein